MRLGVQHMRLVLKLSKLPFTSSLRLFSFTLYDLWLFLSVEKGLLAVYIDNYIKQVWWERDVEMDRKWSERYEGDEKYKRRWYIEC